MHLPDIKYCPSTLQSGYVTYSPVAQAALFSSRTARVPHILPFEPPGKGKAMTKEFNEKRKRISISGVQEKYSLRQEKNSLTLTDTQGTHILKPVPAQRLDLVGDLPANEHVTMQLARQVFGIKTAACGMIFFNEGSPAYLTRRFDYKPGSDGKYLVEDFATLLARSPEKEGEDFKYNASYLDIATHIRRYTAAAPVVLMEFFRLLLFNYLIGNGDAHLKNFSLMETAQGDFVLSPAYDLLNTSVHLDDAPLALHEGLYPGDYDEETFASYGTYTGASFLAFAEKATISSKTARQILDQTIHHAGKINDLLNRSFLSAEARAKYEAVVHDRLRTLSIVK